ncbi:LOW QUALITY PROTEIN: proton myo-inositol cotransporter-like [Menidia menidia]
MSRRQQGDRDYTLRGMSSLLGGARGWRRVGDGGERSLIKAGTGSTGSTRDRTTWDGSTWAGTGSSRAGSSREKTPRGDGSSGSGSSMARSSGSGSSGTGSYGTGSTRDKTPRGDGSTGVGTTGVGTTGSVSTRHGTTGSYGAGSTRDGTTESGDGTTGGDGSSGSGSTRHGTTGGSGSTGSSGTTRFGSTGSSRAGSTRDGTTVSGDGTSGVGSTRDGSSGSGTTGTGSSGVGTTGSGSTGSGSTTGDLERAARKQFQGDSTPAFVYVLSSLSALGGFLLGYHSGVVSGAMLGLRRELRLDTIWQELLVSGAPAAAALGARGGGALSGVLGRRPCVLLASGGLALGGLVMAAAPGKEALLAGRMIVGVGMGVASMTVPVYIAEAAPPHLRGRLVTLNTLLISGGQFTASLVDGAFSYLQHGGWRYMLGLSVFPALLQLGGFLWLPESPRWLLARGRSQRARRELSRIRGQQDIDQELTSIRTSIEEEEKDGGGGGDGPVLWRMLSFPPARRALTVGCGLHMFQQLAGINAVMYYSATILQTSGVRDERLAVWLSGVATGTNFLFTLLGVWLVERGGRRRLTLGSMLGTCVSLSVLALGFLLSANHSAPVTAPPPPGQTNSSCLQYRLCEPCMLDPGCGFCYRDNGSALLSSSCLPVDPASGEQAAWGGCSNATRMGDQTFWAYNYCPSSFSWLVLLGLVLYLAAFAPGLGPMPGTISSEIFPLWARSTGNACAAAVGWSFNVLVSLSFLHLAQALTYYGAFFLYSGLSLLGFVFVYGCLPETKGRRLEEVEELFQDRLCSCGASDSDEGRQVEYIRVKGSNYHLSDNDASDVE